MKFKVGQYYQDKYETILIEKIGKDEANVPVMRVRGTMSYKGEKCSTKGERTVCAGCYRHNHCCRYLEEDLERVGLGGKFKRIAKLKGILLLGELIRIPTYSYKFGYTDEGISDNLNKPKGFRYSNRFLKEWYSIDIDRKLKRHEINGGK